MKLNRKQNNLLSFVKLKHGEQVRKYTGEPYYNHLLEVAQISSEFEKDAIEVALCHDLFEDTECDFSTLYKKLKEIGYDGKVSYRICSHVQELTDVFITDDYPYLNRKRRKENEAIRLGYVSKLSQSVKYADLISNTKSIVANDKKFAVTYLSEKERILELMTDGNSVLFSKCKDILISSKSKL